MAAVMAFTMIMAVAAAATTLVAVTVLVAAAAAALMAVTVLVAMAAAAARGPLGLRDLARKEGVHDVIAVARRTGIDIDAGLSESINSPAANATADKHVNATRCEHAGESTVAGTIRSYNLRGYNLTALNVIELKLLRATKVLENLTVFVGYRNPHNALLLVRPSVCVRLRSGVVCNVSARDDKTATVDQSVCDLGMGAAANHGDRGARDAHVLSSFCLAQLLQINQA